VHVAPSAVEPSPTLHQYKSDGAYLQKLKLKLFVYGSYDSVLLELRDCSEIKVLVLIPDGERFQMEKGLATSRKDPWGLLKPLPLAVSEKERRKSSEFCGIFRG